MPQKRRIIPTLFALLFFIASMTALVQRQAIFDWWRLRNYQPSAIIVQLASDTSMNDSARRLFYVHHPELKDRRSFNDSCPDRGEKTIILGCYIENHGIFLFDVNDVRLNGVEQVTAAHEMLHAAYDRLSTDERKKVNVLLDDAFNLQTNERIRNTIEAYRKAGDEVSNELHSILGTEVRDLPTELENYYRRYFTDRKKIVAFSEGYENEFTRRENAAKSLLKRMEDIEASLAGKRAAIDSLENALDTQYKELEAERAVTNNPNEFNAKVTAYNNQVGRYRQLITEYNGLVNEHNRLLAEYNAIALEENELIKAIDSRPTSLPSE